jgi:2'-hydroxyisoflavone reductase
MRLLILGGTQFAGRHVAAAALARGWQVTLFNRGRTDPRAFPEAERLIGDREAALDALAAGEWDAVVDTSGYIPRVVRAAAETLADRVGVYVFISSAGVYADKSRPGLSEDADLIELDDPQTEDVSAHYDGLKVLCERAVLEIFEDRAAIVRPGLIVGPHDPTNRFTYWVTRIADGGTVLAPEPRDQPVQVIDARDLAAFVLRLSTGFGGTYNAVGRVNTMEGVLTTIRAATGSAAAFRWLAERRLLDADVEPWQDLPLWLAPESDPTYRGFLAMSNARARQAGLVLRPLEDTVRDTAAWAPSVPVGSAGLDRDRERGLLTDG